MSTIQVYFRIVISSNHAENPTDEYAKTLKIVRHNYLLLNHLESTLRLSHDLVLNASFLSPRVRSVHVISLIWEIHSLDKATEQYTNSKVAYMCFWEMENGNL